MWDELSSFVESKHVGEFGDCWQYMGSEVHENGNTAHVFRHRDYFGERKYCRVPATAVFRFAMERMGVSA
jgi:hypothetical protein